MFPSGRQDTNGILLMEIIKWVKFNGSEKKKLTRIIEEEKDSNEMLLYNKVATEFGMDLLEAKEIVLTFIKKI